MTKSENAQAFIEANKKSAVVAGGVVGQGGEGAHYRLANGKSFDLTREECEQVGKPRWSKTND